MTDIFTMLLAAIAKDIGVAKIKKNHEIKYGNGITIGYDLIAIGPNNTYIAGFVKVDDIIRNHITAEVALEEGKLLGTKLLLLQHVKTGVLTIYRLVNGEYQSKLEIDSILIPEEEKEKAVGHE